MEETETMQDTEEKCTDYNPQEEKINIHKTKQKTQKYCNVIKKE